MKQITIDDIKDIYGIVGIKLDVIVIHDCYKLTYTLDNRHIAITLADEDVYNFDIINTVSKYVREELL